MRARRLVSAAAAAALLVLGAGLTALPASAACVLPCGGTFTIDAPAGIGFGSDWSDVTLTLNGSGAPLEASVGLDLSGDVDLTSDAVFVQVKNGATWQDVNLTEAAGHLTGSTSLPGFVSTDSPATVDLRVAVTGDLFDPIDDSADLHTLTVKANLFATLAPQLKKSAVVLDPAETATADIAVKPIDVTTDPDAADATLGTALPIDVKMANNTGAPYHDVVVTPLADGTGGSLTAGTALKRLKAAAASTDTVVEFQKDGTWVDVADVTDPNQLDIVDLAVGASHVTPWRFTYNDSSLDPDSAIGWFANRFAGPVDEAGTAPSPTLVSPDDNVDVVGFGSTDVTIADATPTPVDNGAGENNGNQDVAGEIAATGSPVTTEAGIALALLAAGTLTVAATRRRRHVGLHR